MSLGALPLLWLAAAGPPSQTGVCAPCHPSEAKGHSATLMARTLERGSDAPILRVRTELTYKLGGYSYRVFRRGEVVIYSVTDGRESIAAPIRWVVGQGDAGQTYLLEHEGKLFESWVSYYNRLNGLEVTIGTPPRPPNSLREAFGREMKPKDVVECFTCHSAPGPGNEMTHPERGTIAWTETLNIGVQCENCHAGAWRHAAARARGDVKTARLAKLKEISSEEMSDLCGACHRTWEQVQVNGPRGIGNVRFQPYRIAHSKCYDAADRRIGCTACHNPHNRPQRSLASYDTACMACHDEGAAAGIAHRLCKVSRRDCVSCHMAKYEIPGSHFRFTDHFIRIVKANETYPD